MVLGGFQLITAGKAWWSSYWQKRMSETPQIMTDRLASWTFLCEPVGDAFGIQTVTTSS